MRAWTKIAAAAIAGCLSVAGAATPAAVPVIRKNGMQPAS